MANTRISELPEAPDLTGVVLAGVRSNTTVKVPATLFGGGGAVDSVNGHTGVVVLVASDVGAVGTSDTDASGFGFVVDEDDMASDSDTKVPTQQSVKAYVDSGGYFYSASDLSATFVRQTLSILTGEINTSANKIEKTAHGLRTGQGVLVTGGDGLTADTVVYYVRGRLPNEFTFHPTFEDAVENTNTVDLTGTTAFSVKVLADPDQVAYKTLPGEALDGSDGGFIRNEVAKENRWRVEWFPGSGPDDTDQITRAALAAGEGGEVRFPLDPLEVSLRDTENTCLWQLSGQTWSGEGRDKSTVRLSATTDEPSFVVRCVDGAEDFCFRDMCFDGNRDNITPVGDLYTHYQMLCGPDGGAHGRWERLKLINSWGRTLQTGYESGSTRSEDMIVDDVIVLNSGTKAISLTKTDGGTIKNCYAEVNAYTDSENPGGSSAASGSCFEANSSGDVTIWNNRGKQVGTVKGPGIRLVNGGTRNLKVAHNTIDGASYLGFIQCVNDVDFFENTGRDIAGNGVLIADEDVLETSNTTGIRVFRNTIIDPDDAFVIISANKTGMAVAVEAYIYENVLRQVSGTPTHGIYNNGVGGDALSGTCSVYQWGNKFEGTVPNQLAGPAAIEIQPEPNRGWQILAQSSVAIAHTGTTSETTLATVTVPAYAMGKNGRLRVTAHWSYPSSANNKITRVRFGGTQMAAATNTTTTQQRLQIEIGNQNSASSQIASIPGSSVGFGLSTAAVLETAINTASNANLTFTVALADSGETIMLRSYVVEVYYNL